MRREVVVTGLGIVSPMELGAGIDIFWQGLCNGKNTIKPITSFDVSGHKCRVGGEITDFKRFLDDTYFDSYDKCTQLFALASKQAIGDSKIASQSDTVGVAFGTILGGIISGERYMDDIFFKSCKSNNNLLRDYSLHSTPASIAKRWAFTGPNICINTACASGADAIGYAYREIQNGRADVMLAGGADTLSEFVFRGFSALGALTQHGMVQPFDRDRSGLALSEGSGVIILEAKEHAVERNAEIYCSIKGFGSTNDAYNIVRPHTAGDGLSRAIDIAILESQVSHREIDYISAHGTGTIYNDLMETRAIKRSFGEESKKLKISSIKSMLGHSLGASAAIEAIHCIKVMQNSIIPPTINYQNKDIECDLDYVPNKALQKHVNISMSLSAGFGGQNAVLVFAKNIA